MEPTLTADALLDVWERARSEPPVARALSLLALAAAETPHEQRAQFTIGRRDAELLQLREKLFGPRLAGLATCPACAGQLEVNFNLADLRAQNVSRHNETLALNYAGHEIQFRLPNSLDLAALTEIKTSADDPARRLLERCVLSVRRDGQTISAAELPAAATEAVSQKMSEADPLGDVTFALDCPHCAHRWQSPLDIVSFLWDEIHAWAVRLLRDVHALALAYGWREADILALSPWRRQAYLEMIEP